jgi:NTE family protein
VRPSEDVALPIDFSARYGAGVRRGLSLGGGGVFFVAWQLAYLHELAVRGLRLDTADRVVGTSAGSVVGTGLVAGRLGWMHRELSLLTRAPGLISKMAPTAALNPSQERAVTQFQQAADADPDRVRAIGHAALAAVTVSPAVPRRNLGILAGVRRWPAPSLRISCVDAYSGERCIISDRSGVPIAAAMAASSAVPGLFPTQPVGDRQCMDGGLAGTGTHLDVLAGAERVLVLALTDGTEIAEGMMTIAPGAIRRELDQLVASGATVEVRVPEAVDLETLMSADAVPMAVEMAGRQAAADHADLAAFWA